MISNGTTALATSGADSVSAFPDGQATIHWLRIINSGSNPGFFSVDGGNVWCRLPATSDIQVNNLPATDSVAVLLKRAGSSDLANVWAFGF